MIAENTKKMRDIRNVAVSMSIEDMYANKTLIQELIKIDRGEKSYDELIEEMKKKYGYEKFTNEEIEKMVEKKEKQK